MKKILLFVLLIPVISFGQTIYQKDFNEFWNNINDNYAYLKQQNIDWAKVKQIYQPQADKIADTTQFIQLLEKVLNELYNGHSSLNRNLNSSNRIIPSGADLLVEKINGKYIITDVRKNFGAELCGLKTGMEITAFNDKKIEGQLQKFLPNYASVYNREMIQYAINMLLAGTHDKQRKITVVNGQGTQNFYPDKLKPKDPGSILTSSLLNESTGYIKINNSLWNYDLISAFDKALDSLINTKTLIIDITETPGGGNTTVARSIMGRFITATLPYQQHEVDENNFTTRRYWVEYVIPRKANYEGKVYILVSHWTGSMGEGIAIGFDALKRAIVIGTKMAGLLGAIDGFELTETKIHYQFPTERVYHINGTPREKYIPGIVTQNIEETYKKMKELE